MTGYLAALAGPVLATVLLGIRSILRKHAIDAADAVVWIFSSRVRRIVRATTNMRSYCQAQLGSTGTVRIPGLREESRDIDQLFVAMRLRRGARQSTHTSETVLEAGPRLLIHGDPGSGKSSLVTRLLREACRKSIEQPTRSLLPIHVHLRDLRMPEDLEDDGDRGEWLWEYLNAYVTGHTGHKMEDFFDLSSRSSGLLVLLDGLDEVRRSAYERTVGAINGLSALLAMKGPHNKVVLTLRTQFHVQRRTQDDLKEHFPVALKIQPFTPADIYDFLVRWYKDDQEGNRLANHVYAELGQRTTLREICSNPLILSMYVANYQNIDSAVLPDTRSSFYREIVRELIINRRARQVGDADARMIKAEIRETLFGKLALENLLDPEQTPNQLNWKRAVEVTADIAGTELQEAEATLRELAKATGLIQEERDSETFRFIHLTICEYLAAIEAAEGVEDGWNHIVSSQRGFASSGDPNLRMRLSNIFPFAVALTHKGSRAKALNDVFDLGDMPVFGRCLLETQRYHHPKWLEYAAAESRFLIEADSQRWDREWLDRLHLFQVVVGDAAKAHSDEVAGGRVTTISLDSLFSNLAANDRVRLVQLFSTYAAQDAIGAYRLAAACNVNLAVDAPDLVVQACETPAFLALAIEVAGTADVESWAQVLAEAALRRSLIAEKLHATEAPPQLLSGDLAYPRSSQWLIEQSSSGKLSMLEACVTASVNADQTLAALDAPFLSVLRYLDAPVRMVRRAWLHAALALGVPAAATIGLFTFMPVTQQSIVESPLVATAYSVVLTLLATSLVLTTAGLTSIWRAYRRLYGLGQRRTRDLGRIRRAGLLWLGGRRLLESGDSLAFAARSSG
ncbi:NACHT domain-containing protein [Catellatospora sichuanensis]|uniref:NACHT domain-containing protein n=1 Tax=Catellatospora sichuanensis TaxID=1969805 RepID=UPI001182DA0C|nr:NACHT domain-containing protein [Catellatospora sichuanensis]